MNAGADHDGRCALAALLERAYRLALWLQDAERAAGVEPAHPAEGAETTPSAFAIQVASSELVDVLDEARAWLVAEARTQARAETTPAVPLSSAGTPTPVRSSAPPDR
ncbi:hypothetical protein [Mitsuaria sp. GD03876]|uniref:hypothetical protein n=1 Tax=Mitsuaria sp. GD03876 TaxID=2975399 RepID=UPI0024485AC1|nr:hypothetical protein [Mitsuaria sp. GD03876]MDH0867083.1 hypothetical protein [Mitsuaria sp. GD03876]